jgi:ArsR family transcriptional regulator, arsenate/arsenite/antimonite-responsive transcriptional repressor
MYADSEYMSRQIYAFANILGQAMNLDALFRALADRTRLRLLNLMRDQEVCVCYFVEILRLSQPKISRHLAYLRRAGIVAARREGTWMHYRIAIPKEAAAARILDEVVSALSEDREMKNDLARLARACCAPQRFVKLQDAPAPARFEPTQGRDV